jgi:hypothetical protein
MRFQRVYAHCVVLHRVRTSIISELLASMKALFHVTSNSGGSRIFWWGDGLSFLIIPVSSLLPPFSPLPPLSFLSPSFHTPSPHPSPPFPFPPYPSLLPSFPLPFKGGPGVSPPEKFLKLRMHVGAL